MLTNSSNEIPATKMLDKKIEARYMARSIAEVIRLKIKNYPEEFMEALRDLELYQKNGGISLPKNYKTYVSDFNTTNAIRNNFGLGNENLSGKLNGLKRIYIGKPTSSGNSQFVTDVIELSIDVSYKLTKKDFVKTPRTVTTTLIEEIKFKRRFTPN